MEETTSREKVLKSIRGALMSKTDNPYPSLDTDSLIYHEFKDTKDITFAQEFTKAAGKFIYCENENDLKTNLAALVAEHNWQYIFSAEPAIQKLLKEIGIEILDGQENFNEIQVGITFCEFLIARFGSIVVSSGQLSGRRLNVFPEIHIVFAKTSQIVPELKDALKGMKEKYDTKLPSQISVITGPSRTADIEKTLVMGAHGPKELFVFLVDEN
jgi:L-lactate dehydrogenase complex protein LldG